MSRGSAVRWTGCAACCWRSCPRCASPFCSGGSMTSAYLELLRSYLMAALDGAVAPQGTGRPGPAAVYSAGTPGPGTAPPGTRRAAALCGGHELPGAGRLQGGRGQTYPLGTAPWHPHGPAGGSEERTVPGWTAWVCGSTGPRGTKEAAALPDYVPDGARLVRLSGLCDEDGQEMSFAPADIARLLYGQPDTACFNAVQAVYRRMLSGEPGIPGAVPGAGSGDSPLICSTALPERTAPVWRRCWYAAGAGRAGNR